MKPTKFLLRQKKNAPPKLPSIIKPRIITPPSPSISRETAVTENGNDQEEGKGKEEVKIFRPREYPIIRDLKKLKHQRIYHPDYNTLLAGGQRSYEYAARLGEQIGGLSKFWATSPHSKGFIPGARHWEGIIEKGNGKCFYDVDPWDISDNQNFKGLRFQRVVFFMPTEPKVDEVENLLGKTKHLLEDLDDQQKAQIHFFASEKAKYYAWELETIALKHGLFCNKQIRIPWGGLKRNGSYYIVSFSFEEEDGKKEEEEEEAEEEAGGK